MIYTTYFAKLRNLPLNIFPISICAKAPDWYEGEQYKKLAPTYDILMEWKKNHDNERYVKRFNAEILENLDRYDVLMELERKLPNKIRYGLDDDIEYAKDYHIALVCYEKPKDFCHRHLVADWLSNDYVKVEEFEYK